VNNARYEIPKVTEIGAVRRHSLFAGALWIGGYQNNNLKEAAMTYRQSSKWDFFPGPLDTATASIGFNECKSWDKIWEVTRKEIEDFRKDNSNVSSGIRTWPAHGLSGYDPAVPHTHFLAPFVDVDGDFRYVPEKGDYPDVLGDQTLWFIYNDMGNIHTETGADPIGLEVQVQAFAFTTNDEINNMTFYKSTIINRSRNFLDSTYFGQWVDADLGYAMDDYVGCDTLRNLGICYNGDENDEGVFGYGANPPSVGVDFFEGPNADTGDKKDNDKDGCVDCTLVPDEDNPGTFLKVPDTQMPEKWGMEHFVYYNNDGNIKNGNPDRAEDYYRYLTGSWKNGDRMDAKYMFPGDPRKANEWSEASDGNAPGDRRFLQSAGPFSLAPGSKNTVTVAVVWAKATTGGSTGSLDQLKLADDKAQALYNDSFNIADGPDAPAVTVRELDRKIVIALENTQGTENYSERVLDANRIPYHYKFQGYQVYQLSSATVTNAELSNPDRARLIAQVDIKDEYTKLVNSVYDPVVGGPRLTLMADGANEGIKHTFEITDDAFARSDKQLVNFRFYYYMVIAYAAADNVNAPIRYLPSRKSALGGQIQVFTGVPHKNAPEFGGTELQSDYGDGPELMRIEGIGNGNNIIDLTKATEDEILARNHVENPVYAGGAGPVSVKIYDPTKVQHAQYELRLLDNTLGTNPTANKLLKKDAVWMLINLNTHDTIWSDKSISANDEQLIYTTEIVNGREVRKSSGFSITVNQVLDPGNGYKDETNGFLEATMSFEDETERWLSGLKDIEHNSGLPAGVPTPGNWIRAGKHGDPGTEEPGGQDNWVAAVHDIAIDTMPQQKRAWLDPGQVYEKLLDGTVAPAALVARSLPGANNSLTMGLMPSSSVTGYKLMRLPYTPNVDIVFTSDRSKWSRCVVLEMGEEPGINEGNMKKFQLRNHAGWLGETDAEGNPVYSSDPNDRGRSLFPGYAINLETGDRLNLMFGEDSHLPQENGADMIWNPTSSDINPAASLLDFTGRYLWGGKHWVYVMNSVSTVNNLIKTPYDGCSQYYDVMRSSFDDPARPNLIDQQRVFGNIAWVMAAMTSPDFKLSSIKEGIIPNDVRIRLRLSKPYSTYNATADVTDNRNNNQPFYTFSTGNVAAVHTKEAGKRALDLVGITPNPYYATNLYETSQLDQRVRIINLPTRCEVSIYTINGTLVRHFTKDEMSSTALKYDGDYPTTFMDWDLKNQSGVPIASGVYLIHVNGFELGETVLKWFGVIKPIDLDTF
jgi:hypothetical protein